MSSPNFHHLPGLYPKGQFTPTVCALLRQVAAAWPAERAADLVADRSTKVAGETRRLIEHC